MKEFDPNDYTLIVNKIVVDGDELFEVKIKEFNGASEYGDTREEAIELALDTISVTRDVFKEEDRLDQFPEPSVERDIEDYSGRTSLRMSKSLHAMLDSISKKDAVSLNQVIISVLEYHVGLVTGKSKIEAQRYNRSFNVIDGGIDEKPLKKNASVPFPDFLHEQAGLEYRDVG